MAHHYVHFFIHYLQILIWNYKLIMARLLNTLRSPRTMRSANRREITYFVPMAEEDDGRPESSPFESVSTEVYFGSGSKFTVPSSLFLNSPKLRLGEKRPPRSICLDDVTSAVGHVIFYYLLTDTYQCLRPKGNSQHERLVNELATGVDVYNAARKYELLALQETAKDEIQQLAQQLPFPLVLNLLRDLHLDPSASETWLDDYVQSGLKNLFRTPTAFLDYTNLQVEQDMISFSNIILKNLANLLSNDVAPPRPEYAETPTPSPEPVVIEEGPALDSEPISEVEPLPEPAEPAPSQREEEASPVPALALEPETQPEPEPEAIAMAELATPEPDPAPEEHAGAYEAQSPSSWPSSWGEPVTAAIEKPVFPEDEPIAALEPAIEVPEVEFEYSPPRAEYLDVEKEPEPIPIPIPVAEAPPEERVSLSLTPSSGPSKSEKKKKKKKLSSIFRAEETPTPEPKFDSDETPPVPEPEPAKTAEDPLSPASSSGLKTKKKKKRSIFRTEDETVA
ncbi:hypothetical protein F4859DRAFT_215164 [Xylaria cf. heliscus]|nr:hypothetical protein F4859DRAFT_215164 [Xylaria cf. heliscus]